MLHTYTGKERDSETGLDFFGARYFSGPQGRFTSPDSPLVDQSPGDPQSWNLYSYVRNNPLVATDPDGRSCKSNAGGSTQAWLACNGVSSTIRSSDNSVTIGALPKSPGTQVGERITGAVKGVAAEILSLGDKLVGGNGNTEAAKLAKNLGPSTQDEKFGGQVAGIIGLVAAVGDVPKLIGAGHALAKHMGEFSDLGISSGEALEGLVRELMSPGNAGVESKTLARGRTAYYEQNRNVVVIHDPSHPNGGTVFRPANGRAYYDNQLK